jgi:hypothetical protein
MHLTGPSKILLWVVDQPADRLSRSLPRHPGHFKQEKRGLGFLARVSIPARAYWPSWTVLGTWAGAWSWGQISFSRSQQIENRKADEAFSI